MKKGEIVSGIIEAVEFPNRGYFVAEDRKVYVKGVIEGQKVNARVIKKRLTSVKAELYNIAEPSSLETLEPVCINFDFCGGCFYQRVHYMQQLEIKEKMVRILLEPFMDLKKFEGMYETPKIFEYRNKVELSFGDSVKDGPLELGFHKTKSKYDVLSVGDCKLMDEDFRKIQAYTLKYFSEMGYKHYHRVTHVGYLRYLLIRKAERTGQILVDLVTTTQLKPDLSLWVKGILELKLTSKLAGVLNTITDSFADTVKDEGTSILYGNDVLIERLFDLEFKISTFSFFQTNTEGAEVLYSKVIDFLGDATDKVIFDLYSGTGTISQIVARSAKKVVGVEIVEEAVIAAKENAKRNGINNCEFIAGDVLKVIDELKEKPDVIILDPPRDGLHPKALEKICYDYGVEKIVYISCKPTSLARDLNTFLEAGYVVERACGVDMFCGTVHVETIVLMSRNEYK